MSRLPQTPPKKRSGCSMPRSLMGECCIRNVCTSINGLGGVRGPGPVCSCQMCRPSRRQYLISRFLCPAISLGPQSWFTSSGRRGRTVGRVARVYCGQHKRRLSILDWSRSPRGSGVQQPTNAWALRWASHGLAAWLARRCSLVIHDDASCRRTWPAVCAELPGAWVGDCVGR